MQNGTELAVPEPLSLAQLRGWMRVLTRGCSSLAQLAVERMQQVQQRMQSASTPSAQNSPSSVPAVGTVQAA